MHETDLSDWVRRRLLNALADVQQQSLRDLPDLDGSTVPLQDLPGFDSLCGVEMIVLLEDRLGTELPDELFSPESGQAELSVDDLVERIVKTVGDQVRAQRTSHGTAAGSEEVQ